MAVAHQAASKAPQLPVTYRVGYWHRPDQVLWVDVDLPDGTSRRLQGFDNYWVDSSSYGMWQDAENMGTMYEGLESVAWVFDGREREVDSTPPASARTWRGVMLSDNDARLVGIL